MLTLVLSDIRSVHNVGSIFRTADAAGVSKIFLTGYTPTPLDRFGRERNDFIKVSLGAEKTVPWSYTESTKEVLQQLARDGYSVVALEQAPGSTDLFIYEAPGKIALIVGNEVEGVSPELLSLCDSILEIPMHGEKESLNVSVATGIALFELRRKRNGGLGQPLPKK